VKRATLPNARYIEELARTIPTAQPYYADGAARLAGKESKVNPFPNKPGVYLVLRRVALPHTDYSTRGVNTQSPLVLYVGKTTSRRALKQRLADHFGGTTPNYQGSQFRKFLFQVCQDHDTVKRILWSSDTLVACVEIDEGDEVIDAVEKLAIQVFPFRFNIKER
jgi:hypothetical protein